MSERSRRRGEILGSWLEGPASVQAGTGYPGQRLGLPPEGPGSVASLGRRITGTLIDVFVVGFAFEGLAYALTRHPGVGTRTLFGTGSVLAQWLFLWPTLGQTIGMRIVRIRMVSRSGLPPRVHWALLRVALMIFPVPFATSFTLDGDNRGIQDKASGITIINV